MAAQSEYKVSVRELVRFSEQRGDINFRFSSRSSAMAGIKGHQRVQRKRGDDYVAEKTVTATETRDGASLTISGRVDGYVPDLEPMLVEEIKTTRGDANLIPESVKALHLGQARVYAYLLAVEHECDTVLVRLCYLQLDDDSEVLFDELATRAELQSYYEQLVQAYLAFMQHAADWCARRDLTITDLEFPYGGYRDGQRDMAVSVYRTLMAGSGLVLQAPTGIGKTMAAIFPAIKALKELSYEKIFFLTAKGSGQAMASKAVADLRDNGLSVRDVTLTAKAKACLNPGSPCDPEHCEYAVSYFDKAPGIVVEAWSQSASFDLDSIHAIAKREVVCPFELSLDLSRTADVVICDYNYIFDPSVYLRRYFEDVEGKYAFLVDESHNLVDRGRSMFSATVIKESFMKLKRLLGPGLPAVSRRLTGINSALLALKKTDAEGFERDGFIRLPEVPEKLLSALRRFCESAEDWLASNQPASWQPDLLLAYFDALRLIRVADSFNENYACLLVNEPHGTAFKLNNINPAPGLALGFGRGHASICFSATLGPQPYFRELLGIGEQASWYRIPSPFDPENFGVFTAPFISTAYRDREASLYELVDVIADVVAARAGNYLVFLPSHTYLGQVYNKFVERHSRFRCIRQEVSMDSEARETFLAAFEAGTGDESLVGFAVLGGVFGEGVDLVGTRLIGVLIAGVGLPQLGIERELIRDYFDKDEFTGNGFSFAYQYPGINRVLQTAGRVIRSESDRGIVCLIDRRFAEPGYLSLLPPEWRVRQARTRLALGEGITDFWASDLPGGDRDDRPCDDPAFDHA